MDGEKQLDNLTKDVADIKTALAVNTVKTTNIEGIVGDIKQDLKDIRLSFVTHEEFGTAVKEQKDHENRIRRLELWGAIAIGFMYAIQFYFNFIKKWYLMNL